MEKREGTGLYRIFWKIMLTTLSISNYNKKAVLSEGNRAMPQLFFGLKFADNIYYKFKSVAKLREPCFRAPNVPAQNRI